MVTISHFQGVFVVMLTMLSLSFLTFIGEVIFAAYLDKRENKDIVSGFRNSTPP